MQADQECVKQDGEDKPKTGLAIEFIAFLRQNKIWWLGPIVLLLAILGLLVALTTTPVAPFIYQ